MNHTHKIVAIKNLGSPDHAINKKPPVMFVGWVLSKRCNYDCSYCPSWVHDNYSPHMTLEIVDRVLDQFHDHAKKSNLKIDFAFTGGEPLINPFIKEILAKVKSKSFVNRIMVTTNGAVKYSLLEQVIDHIDNLTVSLHFERNHREIKTIIENVDKLKSKFPNKWINVTVICSTGNFDKIKAAKTQLDQLKIPYSLRSIKPNIDKNSKLVEPGIRQNKIFQENLDPEVMKNLQWILAEERQDQYYKKDELEWLQQNVSDNFFQNMGYWTENGEFVETHSDVLHTARATHFKDWICYIGVDTLTINAAGDVYRGACLSGGKLGNIKTGFEIPTQPICCSYENCIALPDIRTRKCKNENYLHLID